MAELSATGRTLLIAGAANIFVGAIKLIAGILVRLGLDNREYLIGRSADPRVLEQIRAEIERTPGVDRLLDLMTMYLGPDRLIVAARVDFGTDVSADRAEDIADEIDKRLAERLPQTPQVFLDPTRRPSAAHQLTNAGKSQEPA